MISDEMLGNVLTQVVCNMILDRRRASRKLAPIWDKIDHPKKTRSLFFLYVFLDGYGMPSAKILYRKDANLTFLDNVKERPYTIAAVTTAQSHTKSVPMKYLDRK